MTSRLRYSQDDETCWKLEKKLDDDGDTREQGFKPE